MLKQVALAERLIPYEIMLHAVSMDRYNSQGQSGQAGAGVDPHSGEGWGGGGYARPVLLCGFVSQFVSRLTGISMN